MSSKQPTQHDHFTIRGYWWLPGSEHKVAGELRYTETEIMLSLYGGLTEATVTSPFHAKPDQREHRLIYGESDNKTQVTIMDVSYKRWKPNITIPSVALESKVDLISSELDCKFIVIGSHIAFPEAEFAGCRFDFPSLDTWLGISPFRFEWADANRGMNLAYRAPERMDFECEGADCRVSFVHAVASPRLPLSSSPNISHSTYVEITPNHQEAIVQLLSIASSIGELLSVAYGNPVVANQTIIYSESDAEPLPVFFCRHEVDPKRYTVHDFLIRFNEIEGEFANFLEHWMNPNENTRRSRRMLVSAEQRPSDFIELRFLTLAHAAEVLSKEAKLTTLITKTKFKSVRKMMVAAIESDISPELKESINRSLQWANGRSLRDRLRSLLEELDEETRQSFLVDTEDFLGGIVRTRNHYTHYSTKSGDRILQRAELHWGTHKLSLMIRVILLIRAGIPESTIRSALMSHHKLRAQRQTWREVSEEGSRYIPE